MDAHRINSLASRLLVLPWRLAISRLLFRPHGTPSKRKQCAVMPSVHSDLLVVRPFQERFSELSLGPSSAKARTCAVLGRRA